jgi:exodeoxyribonuclease VIII
MLNHVMLDLETMDTRPTAAIVAIGAVAFNPHMGKVDREGGFYVTVDLQSCLDAGLTVSASTIRWWLDQERDARQQITGWSEPLEDSLRMLEGWLHNLNIAACPPDGDPYGAHLEIWGNGADFDNVILTNAYRTAGFDLPWGRYHNRCYRTLKKLFPNIEIQRTGIHHCAIDDAASQAEHACRIIQHLDDLKRLGYLHKDEEEAPYA